MFKKAERKRVKLKLAITGPSGAGKTYSALALAAGLGGKIAVIDTENGSASLYAEKFEFDALDLQPPFTPQKYIEAIKAAEKAGYTTVIIDSFSHVWAGEGGLLQQKEQMDQRGGNSFTNWAKITKDHEAVKSAVLHSSINVIACMRSKQDYAIQMDEKGKAKPQKLGMAPIQREGMEYEFTVVFDVAMNHEAEASKDRTGLFAGKYFRISEETGKEIKAWTESGVEDVEPKKPETTNSKESDSEEEYKVPFGKADIKDKTLKEAGVDVVVKYMTDIKQHQKTTKKPLGEKYALFMEKANEFLADNTHDAPKFDEDEDLPF